MIMTYLIELGFYISFLSAAMFFLCLLDCTYMKIKIRFNNVLFFQFHF